MKIEALEHININVSDLEASVSFYQDIIGLKKGERPNFSTTGAWLYAGDRAVIHLTYGRVESSVGSGTLDHFAFRAKGSEEFIEKLKNREIEYEEHRVPDRHLHQIFLNDPDGIMIEVNFDRELDVGHLGSR